MSISTKLETVLESIFPGEFYPVVHPDPTGLMGSVAGTFAVYTIVGGASYNALDGDSDLSRPRIQVSIYSIDYTNLKSKEAAVAAAMKASNDLANEATAVNIDPLTLDTCIVNVSVGVPTGGYEPNTKRFYVHMEFYVWSRD